MQVSGIDTAKLPKYRLPSTSDKTNYLRSPQVGHDSASSSVSSQYSNDRSHPVDCSSGGYSIPFNAAVVGHLQQSEPVVMTDFVIPLNSVPNLQRVALGIPDGGRSIRFRLLKGQCARCPFTLGKPWSKALFCVLVLSRADQLSGWGHDCTSGAPWEARGLDCNFLVYLVEQGLQKLLYASATRWWRMPYHTQYAKLVELVTSASESGTSQCVNPSCDKRLRCQVSRPAPCSQRCRMAWEPVPLAVRLSPLLRDPPVLDLLCTLAMAELDRTGLGPRLTSGPFPLGPTLMRAALDSLPRREPGVTVGQLLGPGAGRADRELVLAWLSVGFEGMLVPTPASAAVPQMPGPGSLLLLKTHEARQARFQARLRGRRRALGPRKRMRRRTRSWCGTCSCCRRRGSRGWHVDSSRVPWGCGCSPDGCEGGRLRNR